MDGREPLQLASFKSLEYRNEPLLSNPMDSSEFGHEMK